MDAVKLALPAAVAVSKIMGSEGCGGGGADGGGAGGVGVTVMEVEARESDRISIVVAPAVERFGSFFGKKDERDVVSAKETTFQNRMAYTELCSDINKPASSHCENAAQELKVQNGSPFPIPILESKQIQRKSGKVARSTSGCSKRPRTAQTEEVFINEVDANDVKEKSHLSKQKNGLHGKRGDKRNGKVPMKSKYDHFCLKAGMGSFNSAGGSNNFLGIYGLKHDTSDITKHLDELSVNELLVGIYHGPSSEDKGKKVGNLNENILQSVRKACSILRIQKPLQSRNSTEIDNSCNLKVSMCPESCDPSMASRNDGDKGDNCPADPSSFDKVQDCLNPTKTTSNILDFPFCQPKDLLDRLGLPPPKDLDSLLLDVTKPVVPLKNNSESRAKQISHRASLPSFPWSHNSGGHCKSNADAIKISASRGICHGRWVKMGHTDMSVEGRNGFLRDLESLTYDDSLVPLGSLKCVPLGNEITPSASFGFPWFKSGSSSSATCSRASQLPPEFCSSLNNEGDGGHSPRLLAAAQTLCDIAAHSRSLKQEIHTMISWGKKPSEKAMKACRSKLKDKSDEVFMPPKSEVVTDNQSKKPRLIINDKYDNLGHNTARKGSSVNWSMPRSARPSTGKSFRDSVLETKRYNASDTNPTCMMPPPSSRISDKASNSRQKLRKLVPMEWNREAGKLD